jgi:hypothetical protein
MLSVMIALLLALTATVIADRPTPALGEDDEEATLSAAPSAPSPILEALAFAPPELMSFQFTDWTALKALHGGTAVTSASPLNERQQLVLAMVRSEASLTPFRLDRLASWPELWGWDNTDLAWEATWLAGPEARVLRFRDGWDAGPFIARLEGLGYVRDEKRHGTDFTEPPDFDPRSEPQAVLGPDERSIGWDQRVAISPDGRTVVFGWGESAYSTLRRAVQADPATIAGGPVGRAAVALDHPITALIVDETRDCDLLADHRFADETMAGFADDMTSLVDSVGPLHPYQAIGIGYARAGPGEPVLGRYAFAYPRAQQAAADLPGRRTLIDEGYSTLHGKRYREAAFMLVDASADGPQLVLDVAPLNDDPQVLFDLVTGRSLSFATCAQ